MEDLIMFIKSKNSTVLKKKTLSVLYYPLLWQLQIKLRTWIHMLFLELIVLWIFPDEKMKKN